MKNHLPIVSRSRGLTTLMVIIFMAIFLLILSALTGFALEEAKFGDAVSAREEALASAEAGLDYYRWFLLHYPGNLTNNTGKPGPYTYVVKDPETQKQIGSASISVVGNYQCGQLQSIDLTSVGTASIDTVYPRTLFARYMEPSVAAYSYLLNSNVWAGSTLSINGPYFSNGGIRMDASSNSIVSSAVSSWTCTSSYGCTTNQTEAGVFGSGSGSALWSYPASSIDFSAITTGLSNLKTYAKTDGGLYFAPASGAMNQRGYHLIFNTNGTVTVYRVTSTVGVSAQPISGTGVAQTDYSIIGAQTLVGTYTIPTTCSVIFVEDRAWVEGTISDKVTVAAADFVDSNYNPDAYLPNNIYYTAYDGSVGLTLIAEGNVLIPLNSPTNMEVHGIFVAENGSFGRDFYTNSSGYVNTPVPSQYSADVEENNLLIDGSIVSNGRTGTSWLCGSPGTFCSGYQNRTTSYDELQALNPPPFTPAASTNYEFVEWKEIGS